MRSRFTALALTLGIGLAFSCGSDDKKDSNLSNGSGGKAGSTGAAGKSNGSGGSGNAGTEGGAGGDATPAAGAGAGGDAAGAGGSGQENVFHVPTDGGIVQYMPASGHPIDFEFPSSAAGMDITF